jgi:hypothetical protein
MRERIRSLETCGFVTAAAGIWLLCAGPAWAGGASDAGTLLSLLCQGFASTFSISCPQYPTYFYPTTKPDGTPAPTAISPATPIVVELAAWENVSPDKVRIDDSDCQQFGTLFGGTYCPSVAANAVNGPATSSRSGNQDNQDQASPTALSFLNSLAFISNPKSTTLPLTVTQNSDPTANSFVYATVLEDKNGQPKTLDIFYDYLAASSSQGKVKVSFPLAVLVNGAAVEASVVATLTATCFGDGSCSNVKVSANLPGTTKTSFNPSDLGLTFTYSVGSSPNSSSPHPIAELRVPILMSALTDPLYFLSGGLPQCPNGSNPISGYCNAFSANPPKGFAPTFLKNTAVGMAPSAAPQCPGNQPGTLCPPANNIGGNTPPNEVPLPVGTPAPVLPTFGFCASFSNNPAAAFFLAVGTDGSVIVSSPVAPSPIGAQYPACPS